MNVVDSSGWIEHFTDGPNADFFATPIEDVAGLLVPVITIYEVSKAIFRISENDATFALEATALMRQGRVVDIDASLALQAAQVSNEFQLPMADSLILATAYSANAVLWTQDSDFKGISGVKYIEKRRRSH